MPMHVMGIVGWKNSGKTTLVVALVRLLTAQGFKRNPHPKIEVIPPDFDGALLRLHDAHILPWPAMRTPCPMFRCLYCAARTPHGSQRLF